MTQLQSYSPHDLDYRAEAVLQQKTTVRDNSHPQQRRTPVSLNMTLFCHVVRTQHFASSNNAAAGGSVVMTSMMAILRLPPARTALTLSDMLRYSTPGK